LLTEAERAGFDVLLTADKNIWYQQNLTTRTIAIVVLSTPQWPVVRLHTEQIAAAVKRRRTWQLCRGQHSPRNLNFFIIHGRAEI
jgi:hypothetical protein